MLHSVDLDWQDIHPVAMSPTDGMAAFSNGALDALAIYGFQIQRAIATQGAHVLRTALGFLSGNYTASADVRRSPTHSIKLVFYRERSPSDRFGTIATTGSWFKRAHPF